MVENLHWITVESTRARSGQACTIEGVGGSVAGIFKRDHVEVRGLTEDLTDFDVVLSEADLLELKERPKFGVAAQTTQPLEKVRRLVELLRYRASTPGKRWPTSTSIFSREGHWGA